MLNRSLWGIEGRLVIQLGGEQTFKLILPLPAFGQFTGDYKDHKARFTPPSQGRI